MIFILTILLLAADFYYLKNIAGRRLVGLRWWNEVDPSTGDSHWVFESSEPGTKVVNPTDSRFFWIAIYAQPLFWIALALVAVLTFKFIWLPLVGEFAFTASLPITATEEIHGWEHTGLTHGVLPHSYCARLNDHQLSRVLEVRQVQPGVESGRQRLQWRQPRWKYCDQHDGEVLFQVKGCGRDDRLGAGTEAAEVLFVSVISRPRQCTEAMKRYYGHCSVL